VSQRTLLIAALALMAAGLLFGIAGVVLGGTVDVRSEQPIGPGWHQGPEGGFQPGNPGFPPGWRPNVGRRPVVPGTTLSPKPSASPTP
jgi:hypothetical protein